ncbi:response regulator transcription factor [Sharpea azabuensis]|uniref:response regulator transcription factor n=1 Tax=Sharpea azabuensis TaxID=322505 RepID=UPI0013DC974F|nr:response regulator transcription factor [Sharpea azabuensis]
MNSTILIIEDDKDINEMLTKLLTNNNYNVLNAYSGTEGVLVHNDNIDLILLDLMLPGKNGEEIIRELKNKNNVPVIVMSAIQDIDKKVDLFDLGANDYLTKPFHNDELLARIKVQLRDKNNTISNILKFKDVELNKVNFTVNCNNKEVAFTKKEFELLKLLMENENQTLTKSMIFDSIWNDENSADETVWSIGYRLKK